jgi:hypothetical protein
VNNAANDFIRESRVDDIFEPGGSTWCQSLPLTGRSLALINRLDTALIGTPDYLGVAYFWAYEYRHSLREATPKQRKAVHDAFLAEGLAVDGESPEHAAIVKKVTAKRLKKVYG